MKKIKIKFVDFWEGFDPDNNIFIKRLRNYYDVELSENPDFIVCSLMGHEYLEYECARIVYIGENVRPDFNQYDYALGFDYLNFEDRYLRLPHYLLYENNIKDALNKSNSSTAKTGFCNMVVSNYLAEGFREEFFYELSKYKQVDSGGRYLNNIGGPVINKAEFQRKYKFSMAFENSSTSGYTTEKILDAWANDTIPIYWGNPKIGEEFNSKAFINLHNFPSIESAIEHIKEVDQNDELYFSYKNAPIITEESLASLYFDENYLNQFLCQIFNKEPIEAKRISNYGFSKYYNNRIKYYKMLKNNKLISLYRKIRKGK